MSKRLQLSQQFRTSNIDGFRVDQDTGEIYGEYIATQYTPTQEAYELSRASTDGVQELYLLDPDSHVVVGDFETSVIPIGVIDLDAVRAKRGPKPKVFVNTLAPYVQVAHAEGMQWLDDFVYGACYTSGGTSNGTLNVSPSDVLRVCMLPVISTETVRSIIRNRSFESISESQARRIANAAKFAVGGIDLYLSRNPEVMDALRYEVDFIASYRASLVEDMTA
ncbi:hypothetical protein DMX03_06035 [Pseudomonas koreensis]|uniref:hypothetical protein n=1 Tax=Pseudomonas moraviensis TaxID=321662 RepID=UPI000935CC7D|nr:hypothetical protein [Pseudomonas moraviensis]OJT50906.1 hypothetical protein BSZ28_13725 [Pseudomonas moraviensis]PYB89966.1 hypothetical protein DMX03_06035 [Pseudomonas koreensis]